MEPRPARIPFLVKIGFSALTPSAVVAFGDPGRLVSVEGDLLASARGFLAMRTAGTDTVTSLYRHGAWLVWPALTAGCGRR
jgi:hypothetical protein